MSLTLGEAFCPKRVRPLLCFFAEIFYTKCPHTRFVLVNVLRTERKRYPKQNHEIALIDNNYLTLFEFVCLCRAILLLICVSSTEMGDTLARKSPVTPLTTLTDLPQCLDPTMGSTRLWASSARRWSRRTFTESRNGLIIWSVSSEHFQKNQLHTRHNKNTTARAHSL